MVGGLGSGYVVISQWGLALGQAKISVVSFFPRKISTDGVRLCAMLFVCMIPIR